MAERKFTVWMMMRAVDPEEFAPQMLIMNHLGTLKRITCEEMEDYIALHSTGKFSSSHYSETSIEKLNPITTEDISNRKIIVDCFNNCGKIIVDNDIKDAHAYLRKEQAKFNLSSQNLSPFIVEVDGE